MLIRIEHSERDLHRRYIVVEDHRLGRRSVLARLTRVERRKGKAFHGLRLLTLYNICNEFNIPSSFATLLEEASRNQSPAVRWVIDYGDSIELHPNRNVALQALRSTLAEGAYNASYPPYLTTYPLFIAEYRFPVGTDGGGNTIADVMHYLALHTMNGKEQKAFEEYLQQ